MNDLMTAGPEFSPPTRHIGRDTEISKLQTYLYQGGSRHYVYYRARGGLGKTRLLQELQRLVKSAGRGYYTTGILDFYHTDTHSTSDIERAIVEGLDPESRYFPNYRRERHQFELLRERGADPGVMEEHRARLSKTFVADCREMALDQKKLVFCFDTVELLQYESSVVEEMAGLDAMDARVKPWLFDKLSQLNNVLVVFAGRPRLPSGDDVLDPQARLEADMHQAFDPDLEIVELSPFTLEETKEFVTSLTLEPGVELIPDGLFPVVHLLTEGRPIFLHLVVDLLQSLSPEPRRILDLFGQYTGLVGPQGDARLVQEAQEKLQVAILSTIFNNAGGLGGYLGEIALMPKGIDAEVLQQALGLPEPQAMHLLKQLDGLSFAKRFIPPPGAERLHGERLFLHDEMYELLALPKVMEHHRMHERRVAHSLTENYYRPKVEQLRREIRTSAADQRVSLRERMQKLEVEWLYYLLVWNPQEGYATYQSLSEEANSRRWVGFSMRLLDEFLRFYNSPGRREMLNSEGIPPEEILRDSARMWVERFWWWGYRKEVLRLGQRILDEPIRVCIRPDVDVDILGNICAQMTSSQGVLGEYTDTAVQRAHQMLERLPSVPNCTLTQAVARARLLTAIGYLLRLRGQVQDAIPAYTEGLAAMRQAGGHQEEYSMLLNNLAYAHALQGRFVQADTLAHDALSINEEIGYDFATGLTLSTLAEISQMRGNYADALDYGREALELFQRIDDAHGMILAYLALAKTARWLGKQETQKGRRPEEAHKRLEEAILYLRNAQDICTKSNMTLERLLPIYAELGRAYRDTGNLLRGQGRGEQALRQYHVAEEILKRALQGGLPVVERASVLQDLAETQFMSGERSQAEDTVAEAEKLIGQDYRIVPEEHLPVAGLAAEYFIPLAKVELLRGQMAFEDRRVYEGVQHYLLAYAYFKHFSSQAVELETLIRYLHGQLKKVPTHDLRPLMENVHKSVCQQNFGVDVCPFAEILDDLLGI